MLPQVRYPVFRPVEGPMTLPALLRSADLPMPSPALATVSGQFWGGETRSFFFGDVVQVRQCKAALVSFSLDSYRFRVPHIELLFQPTFGPEMRFRSRSIQARPAGVYQYFTRQRLYDHFRRIFILHARELILAAGSKVMFLGPDLPPPFGFPLDTKLSLTEMSRNLCIVLSSAIPLGIAESAAWA